MSASIDTTDNNFINIAYQKTANHYQQYQQEIITRRQYQHVVRSIIPSLNDTATLGYIPLNKSKFVQPSLKGMISLYAVIFLS